MKHIERFARKAYLAGEELRDRRVIDVNDYLQIRKEGPRTISMHIADMNQQYSTAERATLFMQGLRDMAEMLQTVPDLKKIQMITATSWVVREKYRLFEQMGFTIDQEHKDLFGEELVKKYMDEDHNDPDVNVPPEQRFTLPQYAWISREDFLQRYGS